MKNTLTLSVIKKRFSAYSLYMLLFVLMVAVSFANKNFLSVQNIKNIFQQISINGILAVGMTFVIITGGIDLSVGSLLGFSGVIAASLVSGGGNPFYAVLAGIIAGLLFGVINGLLVAYAKIVPFIVTLGMLSIARGVTNVYTHGSPIIKLDKRFTAIGQSAFLGIGFPVWIFIGMLIVGFIILHTTKLGRYTLAVGGNEEAARLSGVNITKVKLLVYSLSALMASLAGILLASRLGSGQPNAGDGYELDAITAAIVGGTSLSGGVGTIGGTLAGAIIIGIINTGMNTLGISPYYQLVIKGSVILAAVIIDRNIAEKGNRREG